MEHYALEGYKDVASWFRYAEAYDRLVKQMPNDLPSTIVEVGCWKGASTAYLGVEVINSGKPITIVVIDTFKGSASEPTMVQVAAEQDIWGTFQNNVRPVRDVLGDRFQLHCIDSLAAAAAWEYEAVDAVWIDADHAYEAVKADIAAWWPLVRRGGWMGGDDADNAEVNRAVYEFSVLNALPVAAGQVWWRVRKPMDGRLTGITP